MGNLLAVGNLNILIQEKIQEKKIILSNIDKICNILLSFSSIFVIPYMISSIIYCQDYLIDKRISATYNKIKNKRQLLRNENISQNLRQRIQEYFEYQIKSNSTIHIQIGKIKDLVPEQFYKEIMYTHTKEYLKKFEILKHLKNPVLLREIAVQLIPELYLENDYIIQKNEMGDKMYFLANGEVNIMSENGQQIVTQLKNQGTFGDIALISKNCKRTASVVSNSQTLVYALNKADLYQCVANYPWNLQKFINICYKKLKEYKIFEKKKKKSMIKKTALFMFDSDSPSYIFSSSDEENKESCKTQPENKKSKSKRQKKKKKSQKLQQFELTQKYPKKQYLEEKISIDHSNLKRISLEIPSFKLNKLIQKNNSKNQINQSIQNKSPKISPKINQKINYQNPKKLKKFEIKSQQFCQENNYLTRKQSAVNLTPILNKSISQNSSLSKIKAANLKSLSYELNSITSQSSSLSSNPIPEIKKSLKLLNLSDSSSSSISFSSSNNSQSQKKQKNQENQENQNQSIFKENLKKAQIRRSFKITNFNLSSNLKKNSKQLQKKPIHLKEEEQEEEDQLQDSKTYQLQVQKTKNEINKKVNYFKTSKLNFRKSISENHLKEKKNSQQNNLDNQEIKNNSDFSYSLKNDSDNPQFKQSPKIDNFQIQEENCQQLKHSLSLNLNQDQDKNAQNNQNQQLQQLNIQQQQKQLALSFVSSINEFEDITGTNRQNNANNSLKNTIFQLQEKDDEEIQFKSDSNVSDFDLDNIYKRSKVNNQRSNYKLAVKKNIHKDKFNIKKKLFLASSYHESGDEFLEQQNNCQGSSSSEQISQYDEFIDENEMDFKYILQKQSRRRFNKENKKKERRLSRMHLGKQTQLSKDFGFSLNWGISLTNN